MKILSKYSNIDFAHLFMHYNIEELLIYNEEAVYARYPLEIFSRLKTGGRDLVTKVCDQGAAEVTN